MSFVRPSTYSQPKYATETMNIGAIEARLQASGFTGRILYPADLQLHDATLQYDQFVARDILAYKRHFGSDLNIDYVFIDSDFSNALCTCINGRYVIVVSISLVDMLWQLSSLMFSLQNIDDIFDTDLLNAFNRSLIVDGMPKLAHETDSSFVTDRRKVLAVYTTRLSLIFLIGHEMAHIMNGHLAVDPKRLNAISENLVDVRDPNNILRAMENDADLFAIYQLVGLVTEHQTSIFYTDIIADIETDPTKRLKCAILSVFMCLNLFDCLNPTSFETATTHPSHYDRASFAERFIEVCLDIMLRQKRSLAEIQSGDLTALVVFARISTLRIAVRDLDFATISLSLKSGKVSSENNERLIAWRALGTMLQRVHLCDPDVSDKIRSVYS